MSINAGSSSLKFSLFNMDNEEVIASGLFERIGIDQSAYTIKYNGEKIKQEVFNKLEELINVLDKSTLINNLKYVQIKKTAFLPSFSR